MKRGGALRWGIFEREFRKLETLEVLDYQTATKTAFEWLCTRTRNENKQEIAFNL